jgi:hypothetical protein
MPDLPPAGDLAVRGVVLDGLDFDLTQGYEPTAWNDGWTGWFPPTADVLGR